MRNGSYRSSLQRSINGGPHANDVGLVDEKTPLSHSDEPLQNGHGRNGERSTETNGKCHHAHTPMRPWKNIHRKWLPLLSIGTSIGALIISTSTLGVMIWQGRSQLNPNPTAGKPGNTTGKSHKVPPDFFHDVGERLYDNLGRYIIEDYDIKPVFSNFLPALAGYYGKPLYAFYVNRGQGIAAFGTESKEYPIMEYHSANIAYQRTALNGFRTFYQLTRTKQRRRGERSWAVVEPFDTARTAFSPINPRTGEKPLALPKRFMYVGTNDLQLQEIDRANGIETNVTFFVLPEEDFGAFVKRTTIRNIDRRTLYLSTVDGLATIEPAGGKMNQNLKYMGRTLEAWKAVYHPYENSLTMPYYRLSTKPGDSASVKMQSAGHWCVSVVEQRGENPELLPIIYDPSRVFGGDTSLTYPAHLTEKTVDVILTEPQYGAAKTASAFSALREVALSAGESITITTFYGKAEHILEVPVISRRLLQAGFGQYKMSRAREIIQQITAAVTTETAIPLFDGHVQQMFLDNSLRGGIPSVLGVTDDDATMKNADEDRRLKVFHFFSRKHGDLERDYNDFVISSNFFSEGPVNFRDVVQNRRNDVVFNPSIGSFNIRTFLSFIQADGYQPLSVESAILVIDNKDTCNSLAARAIGQADGHRAQREAVEGILCSGPFRPGQLFTLLDEQNVYLIVSRQDFIDMVAAEADQYPMAVFKDGYWADYWTYFVDLIESFLSIYPDWEERTMYDTMLPYYFSPSSIKPRDEKYVLMTSVDGNTKHIRQLDAVAEDQDRLNFKRKFANNSTGRYDFRADWQHDQSAKIFQSCPLAKLFLLAALKFSTRDALGMGIEYEAGKPGWDDANNGLVGMLGSGMPETYELVVLLRYIRTTVLKFKRPFAVPTELLELIKNVNSALETLNANHDSSERRVSDDSFTVSGSRFQYWNAVSTARESYRLKTKVTFAGSVVNLDADFVIASVESWLLEVEAGIERASHFGTKGSSDSVPATYFYYSVTQWIETGQTNSMGHPLVRATEMKVNLLPAFLEGPARYMKTVPKGHVRSIYESVRGSSLRDRQLEMYTISASLKDESVDLGREVAFASGWLENQGVWMQVSYKLYLELLRHEMFDEFFTEMVGGGMLPFMDPDRYGRSLMECSSFIASSVFEDPQAHGRGFLARLSGTTAEFLSMWVLLILGPKPFFVPENSTAAEMQLVPALPSWLFKDKGDGSSPYVRFKLFGSITVTYYNDREDKDLFRVAPIRYEVILRDGSVFKVDSSVIPSTLADKIRRVVFVASIDVYF